MSTGFALGALDRYAKDNPGESASGTFDIVGVPAALGIGIAAHVGSLWLGPKAAMVARAAGNSALSIFGYQQGQIG